MLWIKGKNASMGYNWSSFEEQIEHPGIEAQQGVRTVDLGKGGNS